MLAAASPGGRALHVEDLPARAAVPAEWPAWLAPPVYAAVRGAGVTAPWSHQAEVADRAHRGVHTVVATGTASGKSLAFQLPLLSALSDGCRAPTGRGATALYLAPTKALAADQLARLESLAVPGMRTATYDGDTPLDERRWVREHAHLVLTNPDMLHLSLLPAHQSWAGFLRALRYVVVDECHVYRGVFGIHLAAVLRRLRRVCARYRAEPTFVLASATVAEPAAHASALVGLPVEAVTRDGSPRAAVTLALWQPGPARAGGLTSSHGTVPDGALDDPDDAPAPGRRSAEAETADLMAALVATGVQTLAFARSRKGVEAMADGARRSLRALGGRATQGMTSDESVAAYRGGYLPEERRALERGLRQGDIRGLAATNALELGVDITGLDAVLLAGWPGTLASLWQQIGRAGRTASPALAVFVAADDPLDTYLVTHPEAILDRPVEASVVDPANPFVLTPHLAAAAVELPLTEADEAYFGPTTTSLLERLAADGVLRRRPTGWYWPHDERPAASVSLRSMGELVRIVERGSGRVLGTVDAARACSTVHTGAVYVHQGVSHVVTELDLDDACAMVVIGDPGWTTQARSVSAFRLVREDRSRTWPVEGGGLNLCFGTVDVRSRAVSFLRRLPSGEVLGEHPLDLPERTLRTKAVWWTMPTGMLGAGGIDCIGEGGHDLAGSAHAAEHAAIGMLPLFATCDRWDIGGVSTPLHPDTGLPTILVYDGHPGGAGYAERAFDTAGRWLRATAAAVESCPCSAGCPSCVQSPKCGNGNQPLDKRGAARLLGAVLSAGLGDRG